MENGEQFKTDDTSLATYLSLEIEPLKFGWEDRACFWYFPSSQRLSEMVTEYSGGTARVEPRKYSSHFSKRKKELYQAQQAHKNRSKS